MCAGIQFWYFSFSSLRTTLLSVKLSQNLSLSHEHFGCTIRSCDILMQLDLARFSVSNSVLVFGISMWRNFHCAKLSAFDSSHHCNFWTFAYPLDFWFWWGPTTCRLAGAGHHWPQSERRRAGPEPLQCGPCVFVWKLLNYIIILLFKRILRTYTMWQFLYIERLHSVDKTGGFEKGDEVFKLVNTTSAQYSGWWKWSGRW